MNAFILLKIMHLEVMWVNVNDFQRYYLLACQVISFNVMSTEGDRRSKGTPYALNTLPNAPFPISSRNSNGGISRLFLFRRAVRACCCSRAIRIVRSFAFVIEAAAGAAGAKRLGSMLGAVGCCWNDEPMLISNRERGDCCCRSPDWEGSVLISGVS